MSKCATSSLTAFGAMRGQLEIDDRRAGVQRIACLRLFIRDAAAPREPPDRVGNVTGAGRLHLVVGDGTRYATPSGPTTCRRLACARQLPLQRRQFERQVEPARRTRRRPASTRCGRRSSGDATPRSSASRSHAASSGRPGGAGALAPSRRSSSATAARVSTPSTAISSRTGRLAQASPSPQRRRRVSQRHGLGAHVGTPSARRLRSRRARARRRRAPSPRSAAPCARWRRHCRWRRAPAAPGTPRPSSETPCRPWPPCPAR